jgi:hypothetical protein
LSLYSPLSRKAPVIDSLIDTFNLLEIPRTNPLFHGKLVEELHQRDEAWLRDLQGHRFALDGLDFRVSSFLLGGGERVDVVEDVGGFGDGKGGPHFGEHVVLGFAWGVVRLVGFVGWKAGVGDGRGEDEVCGLWDVEGGCCSVGYLYVFHDSCNFCGWSGTELTKRPIHIKDNPLQYWSAFCGGLAERREAAFIGLL